MSRYTAGDDKLWEGAPAPGSGKWIDFDDETEAGLRRHASHDENLPDDDSEDMNDDNDEDAVSDDDNGSEEEEDKPTMSGKTGTESKPKASDLLEVARREEMYGENFDNIFDNGEDPHQDQMKSDHDSPDSEQDAHQPGNGDEADDGANPDRTDQGEDVVLLESDVPVDPDSPDSDVRDLDTETSDGGTGKSDVEEEKADDEVLQAPKMGEGAGTVSNTSFKNIETSGKPVVDSADVSREDLVQTVQANARAISAAVKADTPDDDGSALPMPDEDEADYDRITVNADNYTLVGDDDIGSEEFVIDEVLSDAIDHGASDIHIRANQPIMLRINGEMYRFLKYVPLTETGMTSLIQPDDQSFVGVMLNNEQYNFYTTHKYLDASYMIRTGKHHGERFRLHMARIVGDSTYIVLRHIRPQIYTPEEIGLTDDILEWSSLDQGLILVTGPTGSGKSSTLSTIIRKVQLDRPSNIVTLESPVETIYPVDGLANIIQREVPTDCNSYIEGIRDAMRQDPDVILVGEIRDVETLKATLQACNTGHLTFSTIHADSAPDVITRAVDMAETDSDRQQLYTELSRNLKGILSQRLLMRPRGDGRMAVREVIHVDRKQRMQIKNNDIEGIQDDLRRSGEDLDSQMVKMLLERKTTLKSARSVSQDKRLFNSMISALQPEMRSRIIEDVDRSSI